MSRDSKIDLKPNREVVMGVVAMVGGRRKMVKQIYHAFPLTSLKHIGAQSDDVEEINSVRRGDLDPAELALPTHNNSAQ